MNAPEHGPSRMGILPHSELNELHSVSVAPSPRSHVLSDMMLVGAISIVFSASAFLGYLSLNPESAIAAEVERYTGRSGIPTQVLEKTRLIALESAHVLVSLGRSFSETMSYSTASVGTLSQSAQVAAADSTNSIGSFFFSLWARIFNGGEIRVVNVPTTTPSRIVTQVEEVSDPTSPPVSKNIPVSNTTIIQQPVIERIINTITTNGQGVSESSLAEQLAALRSDILVRLASLSAPVSSSVNFAAFAASQRIDQLSGISLTNITVNGVSGLTDADIPNSITIEGYFPLSGGTLERATTTNATSTNIFSTLARFTTATIDSLTATTLTATNSTTTRLDALEYVAVGGTATTTIRGDGAASTIPYASSTAITVSGTASTSALVASNSFTLANLTGFLKATAGVVATALIDLAADVTGILPIANGGTGTSTAPTYGKVLLGNSGGTYDLVATSSLGISGGGASAWGAITGTLSDQTDLQSALDAKLTLASWYATTTDGLAEGITNKYWSNTLFDNRLSATTSVASITTLANLSITESQISDLSHYTNADTNAYIHASTTIPKNYTANTFTGLQTLNGGLTIASLTGPLQAIAGVVSATSTISDVFITDALTISSSGSVADGALSATVSLLGTTIAANELASADFGDFTCNGTTCSFDADTVSDSEIDYTTVTLADFTNDAGFTTFSYLFPSNATSTALSFNGGLTTTNASTTNITSSYASTSDLIASNSFTFKTVTGFLKATAGAVATALVDLAADVTGILPIANGGTGTSTAPTYGKVLLGNTLGTYDLVATSSLGISGGGASAWGAITGTLSDQTDLQGALDAKLTLASWYATTTDGLAQGILNQYYSDTLANAYIHASTTIPKTYTANTWGAHNIFSSLFATNSSSTNATTTNLAVSGIASTSDLVASNSFTFKTITGFLKATAGIVSEALVDLASDVTGILSVASGGTGWSAIQAGAILYGNGTSQLATSSAFTFDGVKLLATYASTTVLSSSDSAYFATLGGNVGIGTTSLANKLTVSDTTNQVRIAYDTLNFAQFSVDATGNLSIVPSGTKATVGDQNLFVCQSGACPSSTATSTAGNLFVENAVTIGSGFSLREISSTELGLYDASGILMVTFDQGI